jgi:DNA-binding GntR family transcriptional regulator
MQVNRSTLADAAAEGIRQMILNGELAVGSPLRQEELAAQLGVSRTPLREAIAKLATEGLVVADSHRGAVVAKPSLDELRETYEIREALEVLAGRLAAELCTPEDIAALESVLALFTDVTDTAAWAELNTRFHMEMYAISGRKQLCKLISTMRNRTELFVRMLVSSPDRLEQAHQDHVRILAALEARDPDATEEEIRAHLSTTVASVTDDEEIGLNRAVGTS